MAAKETIWDEIATDLDRRIAAGALLDPLVKRRARRIVERQGVEWSSAVKQAEAIEARRTAIR